MIHFHIEYCTDRLRSQMAGILRFPNSKSQRCARGAGGRPARSRVPRPLASRRRWHRRRRPRLGRRVSPLRRHSLLSAMEHSKRRAAFFRGYSSTRRRDFCRHSASSVERTRRDSSTNWEWDWLESRTPPWLPRWATRRGRFHRVASRLTLLQRAMLPSRRLVALAHQVRPVNILLN